MEQEKRTLIAKRVVGKGDTWNMCTPEGTVIFNPLYVEGFPTLTHVLEEYFQKTKYKGDFILSPIKGEIYSLSLEEIVVPPPKKFNIYGDY